jgi:hypothetical protein
MHPGGAPKSGVQRLDRVPVIRGHRSGVMTSQEKDLETTIPDLRDIPMNRLAELGSSALAHSIALYRERLRENGIPLSSFQARI